MGAIKLRDVFELCNQVWLLFGWHVFPIYKERVIPTMM